jgi:hypothetical protein
MVRAVKASLSERSLSARRWVFRALLHLDRLPRLGPGKVDYPALQRIAESLK